MFQPSPLCLHGCGNPTYNNQPGFCSKSCRDAARGAAAAAAAAAAGSTPARPLCVCGKPTWNGQAGEFCSKTCRQSGARLPVRGPVCLTPNCGKPTWNSQENEFCSKACRISGLQIALCTQLQPTDQKYKDIMHQFEVAKKQVRVLAFFTLKTPTACSIWKIQSPKQVQRFEAKCKSIGHVRTHGFGRNPGNVQRRFHGTHLRCNFSGTPCNDGACRVCCIIKHGFNISKLGSNTGNRGVFGAGHYSTSNPCVATNYGNAMFVVNVAVGKAVNAGNGDSRSMLGNTCFGGDSVFVDGTLGDELVVPQDDQIVPRYLILFRA